MNGIAIAREPACPMEIYKVQKSSSDHNPINIQIGHPQKPETITDQKSDQLGEIQVMSGSTLEALYSNHHERRRQRSSQNNRKTAKDRSSITIQKPQSRTYQDISDTIKELIRKKNKARRSAQRTREAQDKLAANQLNREIKNALTEHFRSRWNYHLQHLDRQQSRF